MNRPETGVSTRKRVRPWPVPRTMIIISCHQASGRWSEAFSALVHVFRQARSCGFMAAMFPPIMPMAAAGFSVCRPRSGVLFTMFWLVVGRHKGGEMRAIIRRWFSCIFVTACCCSSHPKSCSSSAGSGRGSTFSLFPVPLPTPLEGHGRRNAGQQSDRTGWRGRPFPMAAAQGA